MADNMIAVRLTEAERDDVVWAFGAMMDYWGAECAADSLVGSYIADPEGVTENNLIVPSGAFMPFIDGDRLILSNWSEVNNDLLYRIEQQLPDMADDAACFDGQVTPQRAGQIVTHCARLAEKIRDAMSAA